MQPTCWLLRHWSTESRKIAWIWTLTFSPFLYQLCVRVFNSLQLKICCRTYVSVCTMYHVLHKEIDMIDKTVVFKFLFCSLSNKWISFKYSSLNKGKRKTSCNIFFSWLNYLLSSPYSNICSKLFFKCHKLFLICNTCNCTYSWHCMFADFCSSALYQRRHLKKYYKETQTDFFVPISKVRPNRNAFVAFSQLYYWMTPIESKRNPKTLKANHKRKSAH